MVIWLSDTEGDYDTVADIASDAGVGPVDGDHDDAAADAGEEYLPLF